MGDSTRTRVDAYSTCRALFSIYEDSLGFLAYGQGVFWAGFDARVVLTLSAEVRKFGSGDEHEDLDSGCFRPYFSFVKE